MTHMPAEYAFLDKLRSAMERSQFGTPIDLDRVYPELVDEPLVINGKETHSPNPNRYKQHGFHFNADNCIACHACESACSEKNDLPPHLAFRKVGYLEGGAYPDFLRVNISMACNHCENPVCLKGCPTRAYTKYAEYGAVLQDPDICFGCGYCTWVCPYNAPQLDPVKGQVEKCNMCIDRLEQGLKPACVAACLGNALEFGVIEDLPQGHAQTRLAIPGFPDPSISRPNIRFQQVRSLPPELARVDAQPLRYQRGESGRHETQSRIDRRTAEWGIKGLSSRENPLVAFTLLSQLAIGAFLCLFLGPKLSSSIATLAISHPTTLTLLLLVLIPVQGLALAAATSHIGKPHRFYRGFNNLRHSWVSREAAFLMLFFGGLGAYALMHTWPILIAWLPEALQSVLPTLFAWTASVAGAIGLYCMTRIYRIKARPYWDHWHTGAAFAASAAVLAGTILGSVFAIVVFVQSQPITPVVTVFAVPTLLGLAWQAFALYGHRRDLNRRGAEASVSADLLRTAFGKTDRTRFATLGVLVAGVICMLALQPDGAGALVLWLGLTLLTIAHELVSRALFYVVVIPTTIPGAFFWNNTAFAQHARETGLAHWPQVGVPMKDH